MADDLETESSSSFRGPDPTAAQIAMAGSGHAAEEAREYLKKQARLSDLQIENLEKLDAYELSHLRWRRFNDQMRGALQIIGVALGVLLVVAIGATLWNASQADGLIVDAFSVPPDFERSGMAGDVIAGDVTDRLAQIRGFANAHSFTLSRDVTKTGHDIRVEIPDTGISIAEAWRYLRSWLGHERHVTGNLRSLPGGRIMLTAALDGIQAVAEGGRTEDLPDVERKAAERVFAAFDPVNYINYLAASGRNRDAYAAAKRFATIATTPALRADSYALLAYTTAEATGDLALAIARARLGSVIDPKIAVDHVMAARFEFFLGDDEDVLAEERIIVSLDNLDQPPGHRNGGFDAMRVQANGRIAVLTGDWANADRWYCPRDCPFAGDLLSKSAFAALLHDRPRASALLAQGLAAENPDPEQVDEARYRIAADEGDWRTAAEAMKAAFDHRIVPDADLNPRFLAADARNRFSPSLALAYAHLGQFRAAHETIETTPRDCVRCDVARGEIDALEGNRGGAAYWFQKASVEAPSVPFATASWGAMLLAKGDAEGAIAKFAAAHARGPRFADPLEMWGEALMAENRSDLALAKFEEANTYAPNWGRLHFEWGKALSYLGRKDDAQKQFALARGLAEKAR